MTSESRPSPAPQVPATPGLVSAGLAAASVVVLIAAILWAPSERRLAVVAPAAAAFVAVWTIGVLSRGARTLKGLDPDRLPMPSSTTIRRPPPTPTSADDAADDASVGSATSTRFVEDAGQTRGWRAARTRISAFTRPKQGNSSDENEDRLAFDADNGVAAVSDGASSSFRSGEWARWLTTTFIEKVARAERLDVRELVQTASRSFAASAELDGNWWAEDAAAAGAFATFVGLRIVQQGNEIEWRAVAVGDSILVQLRHASSGPQMVDAFPVEVSGGFPPAPNLVRSDTGVTKGPAVRMASGPALAGDVWLLLTDEIAKWALRREESGNPVWSLLLEGSDASLNEAFDAALSSLEMANDDLTLVRIAIVADH